MGVDYRRQNSRQRIVSGSAHKPVLAEQRIDPRRVVAMPKDRDLKLLAPGSLASRPVQILQQQFPTAETGAGWG
jgi:hypothetical protein